MNRFLLVIALSAGFSVSASAQKVDTLRRNDPGGWEFLQVRSGEYVMAEGKMLNGKREGVWTEFWPSKLPHYVTSYSKGLRNGMHLDIRKSGQVEQIENYSNDKLDGPLRRFTPAAGGGIIEEIYYSEGQQSGSVTKWYPSGRLQEQSNFNHDLRDGKTSYYKENGVKVAEYTYDRGRLDGDAALYNDNGKVKEFGRYVNDVQTGLWKEYNDDGKLLAEGQYKDGEKNGPWKEYGADGKVKTVNYKMGKAK